MNSSGMTRFRWAEALREEAKAGRVPVFTRMPGLNVAGYSFRKSDHCRVTGKTIEWLGITFPEYELRDLPNAL